MNKTTFINSDTMVRTSGAGNAYLTMVQGCKTGDVVWSRTVTLDEALSPLVVDRMAERRKAPVGQPSHDVG